MAPLKTKGDIAELKVAADLGRLHRVQVKWTKSDGRVVKVKCYSHSLTAGRVRATKHYSTATVDWVGVYDSTTKRCYYVPSWMLGVAGRSQLMLRLTPALNNQSLRIRRAEDYLDPDFSRDPSVEPAGFEPAASTLQTWRSAN